MHNLLRTSQRASADWADRLGYDRAMLKQNKAPSVALCAELADEFAAAIVASAIAGVIGPRRDARQYDAGMTVAEACDYHSPQVEAFAGTAATSLHAYTLTNTPEAISIQSHLLLMRSGAWILRSAPLSSSRQSGLASGFTSLACDGRLAARRAPFSSQCALLGGRQFSFRFRFHGFASF
jgi:S-methylmethionine-dependent homocysteine/selenocysteine methylase